MSGIEQAQQSAASAASGQVVDDQSFQSKRALTDEQRARAIALEPAFEHLLREVGVDEATIWALRHARINDRETFTGLVESASELKEISTDLGIDISFGGMPHRRELSKLTTAWKRAKAQAEVKEQTEALQKQHGERITLLPEDWTSIMVQFKARYGNDLTDDELPAQAYFEDFQERLAAGMLRAEPLDHVISQAEAEEQDRTKPEPARQYGIHLDSRLTLQTRRKYTSSNPKDIEELRAKYDVMSNLWLLAQMRQPGRVLYADLSPNTFPRMLKELLNKKNFNLKKELLDDKNVVAPPWNHCLTYEYELRKEACRIARETATGISAAWWSAYNSSEHRMLHWLQLVSLANTPSSSSSAAKLERELAELRKARSRTPRVSNRGRGSRALPNAPQLALPAPASSAPAPVSKSRGKGRKGKGKGKGGKKAIDKTKTWQFGDLIRGPREIKDMFHGGRDNTVCYNFQEHLCTEGAQCNRQHCCIGCGGSKPYNECHCLQQRIQNLP